jgi:oligoendopeptidase F
LTSFFRRHKMKMLAKKFNAIGMGTNMQKTLSQTWDLDAIFPGGSESAELLSYLEALEIGIQAMRQKVLAKKESASNDVTSWREVFDMIQNISGRLKQASAFISCLNAQNVKDHKAKLLSGRIQQMIAAYSSVLNLLDEQILQVPETKWETILNDDSINPIRFPLEEIRRRAKEKLSPEQEALAGDLAVDGYHAWSELYNTVVGRMSIPFEEEGKTIQLSVGQAENKMASKDREVRQHVFSKFQDAWANEAELCANSLNHLAGFRLNLYRHRGWDSVLKEPLDINRMSETTLEVMWDSINSKKDRFVEYLNRKAKLLGLEKLGWYDVSAPIGSTTKSVSYDEGAAFIVEQFGRFSPKMAEFAEKAFEERWIEAEDRPGKRPGGFCTSFPGKKESRIFMTYSGSASNVATLAHELGHAYHQHVMNDLPPMTQNYAMNVAETASTFAEMIVADAAVKSARNDEEKLVLLEDKARRSVSFFMNIHARFLFETKFYETRKKGLVGVDQLNELMEDAQKTAYKGALDQYHPYFWASKLHFYITRVPFYNFPYTFGYLFSSGVYARALEEGKTFEDKYIDLLKDTGRMSVETLASRHLGVDLTKPDFWQSAVDLALVDVEEFLRLTE